MHILVYLYNNASEATWSRQPKVCWEVTQIKTEMAVQSQDGVAGNYTRARLSSPRKTLYTRLERAWPDQNTVRSDTMARTLFSLRPLATPLRRFLIYIDQPDVQTSSIQQGPETDLAILEKPLRPVPPTTLLSSLIRLYQDLKTCVLGSNARCGGWSDSLNFLEHEFEDIAWCGPFLDAVGSAE